MPEPGSSGLEPGVGRLEPVVLHTPSLLAPQRDWRQPLVAIGLLAFDDRVELFLDRLGDRSHGALAYFDLVDGADRRYLGGGAGEKGLVGDVEHLAWDHLLEDRDFEIAGDLQDGLAGDTGEHGVAKRRGLQHAVAHKEDVLTGAFAYVAVGVEGNAFGVAVDDGFHLDELRIHVIGARLRHCRESVGGESRPGGDADIAAGRIRGQTFSPRLVDDVDLSRRVERVHASLAVASQHNWPDVAGPHAVVGDHVAHGFNDVVAGEVHLDAINLRRIQQALRMFLGAENRRAARGRVAAHALNHRRAVVDDVRHHVDGRVVPANELAVVPDLVGLLNRHGGSLLVRFDAVAMQAARLFRRREPRRSRNY